MRFRQVKSSGRLRRMKIIHHTIPKRGSHHRTDCVHCLARGPPLRSVDLLLDKKCTTVMTPSGEAQARVEGNATETTDNHRHRRRTCNTSSMSPTWKRSGSQASGSWIIVAGYLHMPGISESSNYQAKHMDEDGETNA